MLQDGAYNYGKPLHFDGADYLSVYDTNLDLYNTASKVDAMASGLAMLCLYKLGWQVKLHSFGLSTGLWSGVLAM